MADFSYQYDLPPTQIANQLAEPRDAARLLVLDTSSDKVSWDTFDNLDNYLPKEALLVLNDTKVVPARVKLRKETGGIVEGLLLINEWQGSGPVAALLSRQVKEKHKLEIGPGKYLEVVRQAGKVFYLQPLFENSEMYDLLDEVGQTPIPKYIKPAHIPEGKLREDYQSIFSRVPASVAAPTASLHFTERVFKRLDDKGIKRASVTLHVGLGTFAPVSPENLATKKLHKEIIRIPKETSQVIRFHKQDHLPVVAVGTTVIRTLESQAECILHESDFDMTGATDIFIQPSYEFKIVDALVTNFHLPGSSLMMLVQAFLVHKGSSRSLVDIYNLAIKAGFRFYSFGDAMLIK